MVVVVRSKKPEGPTADCQKPEHFTLQLGVILASGFWLLASS
jgi:hypothetical protein